MPSLSRFLRVPTARSARPALQRRRRALLALGLALAATAGPLAAADDFDPRPAPIQVACDDPPAAHALLPVLNAWRAQGAACGEAGAFDVAQPLRWDDRLALTAAQQARAVALRRGLSHRIDGADLGSRLHAAAYEPVHAAENLAAGPLTLAAAAAHWMGSAAHCANLMAPRLRDAGIGCAVGLDPAGEPIRYWAVVLGEPRTATAGLAQGQTVSARR